MLKIKQIRIGIDQGEDSSYGLVRVCGWLTDKCTVVFQLVKPVERYSDACAFHTRISFVRTDCYFHVAGFADFEKRFRLANRDDVSAILAK